MKNIKPVIILFDNDKTGNQHGGDKILAGLTAAKDLNMIELFELTNWDKSKELIDKLIKATNKNHEIDFLLHAGEKDASSAFSQVAFEKSMGQWKNFLAKMDNQTVHILYYSGGIRPNYSRTLFGIWLAEVECWHAKKGRFTENTFCELYKRNREVKDTGFLRFAPLNEDNLMAISSALLALQLTLDSYYAQKSETVTLDNWMSPVKSKLEDCLFTPISDSVLSIESPGTLTKEQQNKFMSLYFSQDSGQLTERLKTLKDADISGSNFYGALRYFWHLIIKSSDNFQLTPHGKISLASKALKEIKDLKMILYDDKVPEGW